MALCTPALVEQMGALTPQVLNQPDQTSLDAFVQTFIDESDAWMQGHLGGNYGIVSPAWAATLQQFGEAYLTLEAIQAVLKNQKVMGTHYAYISEDSPAYQTVMETDWGELAIRNLDLWVTPEIAANRGFAMPQLLISDGLGPVEKMNDTSFPSTSEQLSEELDWARSLSDPDLGTIRR